MERHDLAAHAAENRDYWNAVADDWVGSGERNWARETPSWGMWGASEDELGMLSDVTPGVRAVELGCGTGYVSAWMARRGADVTGIDLSERQLETARRLAALHDLPVTLVHGSAEATPFEDEAFDVAISEYGAAIWCDPYAWVPEAHRILRPGGRLVFLGTHPLVHACSPWDGSPAIESLVRPYFGLHRLDWTTVSVEPGGIEFSLPISEWVSLFRRVGFDVEDYREPRPPDGFEGAPFNVSAAWARRFPSEQVWKVRKAGPSEP